jgi:outer membrane receptor protein involved in Fe transport
MQNRSNRRIRYYRVRRGTRESMHRLSSTLVISVIVTCSAANAQGPVPSPTEKLAPIIVVSPAPLGPLQVPQDRLPFNTQTTDDVALNAARPDNLADFMSRNLTGVNVNGIQGSPFQTDITYRGFRLSPILGTAQGLSVYLDGVRINEAFGDVVLWDMVPEGAIANLALMPGSNPLFGLNTLGGALAMTTKSGKSHPELSMNVSGGSFQRGRADLAYGKDWGTVNAFIAATAFTDSGWRTASEGKLGNVFAKLAGQQAATEWTLAGLAGRSKLNGNGLLPSTRAENDGFEAGLYEADRRAVYTFPDTTRNTTTQLALSGRHSFDERTKMSGELYSRRVHLRGLTSDVSNDYSEYVARCAEGFRSNGQAVNAQRCVDDDGHPLSRADGAGVRSAVINETDTQQRSHGAAVSLGKQTDQHQVTVGLSLDRSTVRYAQYVTPGSFDETRFGAADVDALRMLDAGVRGSSSTVSAFATDTWAVLPRTFLTSSVRWNRTVTSNTLSDGERDKPREQFTYSKVNPALGITHQVDTALTLFGGLSQGTRVPTVIELGCADPESACRLPTGLQSDPYLKQVVARTAEIGARFRVSRDTRGSFALYRTDNRDDIIFLRAGASLLGYFNNFDKTRRQGLELSLEHRLDTVDLRADFSAVKATYEAQGTLQLGERSVLVRPGTPIAGIPSRTFKLNADWHVNPALTLGLQVSSVSGQTIQGNEDGLIADTEPGENVVPVNWRTRGYTLLNLKADWKFSDTLTAYLRVNNVADRRYETFGTVGTDLFPNGKIVAPHEAAGEGVTARFLAPGAPRAIVAGVRYVF